MSAEREFVNAMTDDTVNRIVARWRPIDTYRPGKDDAHVLIAVPMEQHARPVVGEAKHHGDNGWWWANNDPTDHWGDEVFPSHWMPLPAPPEG